MLLQNITLLLLGIVAIQAYDVSMDFDVDSLLLQQQRSLANMYRTMQTAVQPRAGISLLDDNAAACFDYYIQQQNSITSIYREEFNQCKSDAEAAKAELTRQSNEKQKELLAQGQQVCTVLNDCAEETDGLKFFQCYDQRSNAGAATLNQISVDSNDQVNYLSVQYEKIENTKRFCTTAARNKYNSASYLNDKELNKCVAGESTVPPQNPETPAPETPAPETPAPETPAPETPAPETPAPETPAPETPAPETPAPETPAPETPAPETPAPETPAPETPAPETPAPETPAPETPAPETPAPETPAPETPAPETPAPETPAPETPAPETPAPETPASETPAPETPAPETPVPETPAPETPAPETPAPETPSSRFSFLSKLLRGRK